MSISGSTLIFRCRPFSFLLLFILPACSGPSTESPPFSPEEALSTFQVADGFQIELFAAEPLISDPVAMEVDENGDVWVVEMHGYPLDVSGSGVIKRLVDEDGDGLPDKSEIFHDGLILPTGIMRWKNGFIVTDAPDVLYLEDTDGDGKADRKEVLLTGFARSNPQHNLNSPRFELDNWIYLGHENAVGTERFADVFGDKGEQVYFPDRPDAAGLPPNANGRMVRFDPESFRLEMLSGKTQFNYSFSPYGHLITSSNFHYLFHEVFAARYLALNEKLLIDATMEYLPADQSGTEVFPITDSPEHQLLTDVGVMTSGCGVTWYKGGIFPEDYDRVTFTAEPVHNLVHTDLLSDHGATFAAESQFSQQEFLASTDAWFRPVNFYTGPDGALYLMDYYREYVEHPEWMSDEVNASGALYNGMDRGRIYRITPAGTPPVDFTGNLELGSAPDSALVAHLAHPNIWWRRHAQRLLVSGRRTAAVPYLQKFLTGTESPLGRVHALWTLHGLGDPVDQGILEALMKDPEAGVRENAVRVAELYLEEYPGLSGTLIGLQDDPDARVRFQALCTLGFLKSREAMEARKAILVRDLEDEWVQVAALAGVAGQEAELFASLFPEMEDGRTEAREKLMVRLGEVIARRGDPTALHQVFGVATSGINEENAWLKAAALRGLARGFEAGSVPPGMINRDQMLEKNFSSRTPPEYRQASLDLLELTGQLEALPGPIADRARAVAVDRGAETTFRTDAVRLLSGDTDKELLRSLVQPDEPVPLQLAALQKMGRSEGVEVGSFLLERWASLTPELRNEGVNILMKGPDRRMLLLDAVENGQVDPSTIGWPRTVSLLNEWNDAVRSRAREVLQGNETRRETVMATYRNSLALTGDAARGAEVFDRACAQCHQINGGSGIAIGPDLASIRNRTETAILNDILQPNQSIADGFELWSLTQNDGSQAVGIIVSESAVAITLRDLGGNDNTIPRSEVRSIEAQPTSAMPEGLEAQIGEQEMADLLAFLKGRQS